MTAPLRSALAAELAGADVAYDRLLASVVATARSIFGARASSILLLDEATDELVFAAVAGEGADRLPGTRFPASRGIAGWVLGAGQPLVIEDVAQDPRFARDVAERTGYVPHGLMAAPLLLDDVPAGVLQVLDRPRRPGFSLREMELLGLFADQAALALDVVARGRRAQALVLAAEADASVAVRLDAALQGLDEERRAEATAVVEALVTLLARRDP